MAGFTKVGDNTYVYVTSNYAKVEITKHGNNLVKFKMLDSFFFTKESLKEVSNMLLHLREEVFND